MTFIVPERFVDVMPTEWKPGDEYGGFIESEEDQAFGLAFPAALMVDRGEWRDRIEILNRSGVDLLKFCRPKNDQSPESSCVYNASEAAWRAKYCQALGLNWEVCCSPMSGYCRVTRRRHSGSRMWEAGEQLRDVGLLPEARHKKNFRHTFHQNSPFVQREQLPDGFEETAKYFRVLEWYAIRSAEEFASAMLHRIPIVYGRRGHSIAAMRLVWDGRRFLAEYMDSYGPGGSRSNRGTLFDSEGLWATGGAWSPATIYLPDDPNRPAGEDTIQPLSAA